MKKLFKKLYGIVMALSILLSTFLPGIVYATEYGEGTATLSVGLTNTIGVTSPVLTVNGSAWASDQDVYKTTNGQYAISFTATSTNKVPKLQYGGNWSGRVSDYTKTNEGDVYTITFNVIQPPNPEGYTYLALDVVEEPTNNNNENNQQQVSTEDYDVTIKLDENMAKYYTMSKDGSTIKLTLKDGLNTTISTITLVNDQDNSALTPTVTCDDAGCTMVAPANTKVNLNYDTDVLSLYEKINGHNEGYRDEEGISNTKTLYIDEPRDFDGKAVLLWDCDGKICYNYSNFDNLSSQVAKTTYMDEKDIANQNTNAGANTIKFSVHSREKFFAPYWKFSVLKAEIDAGTKKLDAYKGESGIDYPPLEEPIENNTYISYMNRGPKMIIYNEDYRGIKLADLENLNYYPSEWANAFKRRESYDISGTTKENPTEILALLLQDSVTINALSTYNGFTIKSIEALDVPEGAVEVAKVDNKFNLIFHSNYFEKVVFKALDNEDHEYYFLVNRRTMDPGFNRIGHGEDAILEAEIFYDNHKTYENYNVLGKIQYKNGTTKVIELTITNYGDDGFGNPIDALEWNEDDPPLNIPAESRGKGIKRAKFIYKISDAELKTVDKIYINVENAGSTSTSYAGNFAGSGKGNVIDMANWKLQLYGEDRV